MSEKNHYWEDKIGKIHSCRSSLIHDNIRLVWTDCEQDVPANESFTIKTKLDVTCKECIKANATTIDQLKAAVKSLKRT